MIPPDNHDPVQAAPAGSTELRGLCEAWAARALRLDHDLRTPLGTLTAVLEVLRGAEQNDPAQRAATLAVMERQLQRLLGIADGLHALGRELDAADGAGRKAGAGGRGEADS